MSSKKNLKRAATLSPFALALAACGGTSGVYRTGTVNPVVGDDETTIVVLDYFSTMTHGDDVTAVVEANTDVNVIGDDMTSHSLLNGTPARIASVYEEYEAEVINTSFVDDSHTIAFSSRDSSYADTVRTLYENGTFVVAASGNDYQYGAARYQVDSDLNLIVGAVNEFNQITSYSNYHQDVVDFYAEGRSEDGQHGTSFAAPHVSAYVAELMEANPDYTMSEIRTLLELNSDYVLAKHGGHEFVIQVLDGISTTDHEINIRVRVEAAFELFADTNPTWGQLSWWTESIRSGTGTFDDLVTYIDTYDFSDITLGVDIVEKAQAHYHWYENRESTDAEVLAYLDNPDSYVIPTSTEIA